MAMMTMMITKKLMTNKIDRKFAAKAGSSLHVICKHPIKWLCCPSINLLSPPAEHLSDDVCTLYNHFIIVSLISCIDVKLTRSNVYARLKPFISRLLWRQHCDPVIELIADCLLVLRWRNIHLDDGVMDVTYFMLQLFQLKTHLNSQETLKWKARSTNIETQMITDFF